MATALFVCLHNAGRSQMSAALFERAADGRHRALSAGSEADPGGRVHPQVVEVMRELGIDLSDRRPQQLTRALAEQADVVVTMGCGDSCPYIPGKRYIDWELEDPKGRPIEEVRATRDEIGLRVSPARRRPGQHARHVTLARAGGSAQRVARWRAAHARQANVTSTSAAANGNPPAGETAVHSTPATPLATRFPRL